MTSIQVVFAVHNHQPIGNFENVMEEAYQHSYLPFLEVLDRHPSLRFTQHWTGTLLAWIAERHPELIALMRAMVQRGQLELLTGAYYEAILAVIPEEDRLGQIAKLTSLLKDLFGVTPRGMWLAERVWEPQLASTLARAGVEFVMVDDTHFRHAGLRDEQLLGYYQTEDLGYPLSILPIDKVLRYVIPFRGLHESFDYFRAVASEGGERVVVHADDGEKFGVWPKTYRAVYTDGWLESFCRMLEQEQSWVKTTHVGTLLDLHPPVGRIYLPTASYAEMMKWALPPAPFLDLERFEADLKQRGMYEANAMFVRGGFWRNFLAKYPEANYMHKKMLRISRRLHEREREGVVPSEARDALWAGQCNDPYWHGVFGGLYLPNLRFPVYRNLLRAETALDALPSGRRPLAEEADVDADGFPEVVIESRHLDLCLTPASGGSMIECSVKPACVNLLDILSRREEGHHRRLLEGAKGNPAPGGEPLEVKEEGLEQHLFFDWYRHGSLLDHFFGEGATLASVHQCRHPELGDFVNQPYTSRIVVRGKVVTVTLERDGALWRAGRPHRVTVRKVLTLTDGESAYTVEYRVVNREAAPLNAWFGVEWCIGAMAGDAPDRYYEIEDRMLADRRLRSMGEERGVSTFSLVDRWLALKTTITLDTPATLWRFPLDTVSLSEGGFERIFQGAVVLPSWQVRLAPDAGGFDGAHVFRMRATQAMVAA